LWGYVGDGLADKILSTGQGRISNMGFTTLRIAGGIAGAVALLTLGGCATVNNTVDSVKDRAAQLAQAAKAHAEAVYQRQQHYMAEHEVLKTFEDASEHSESEVLKVLHAARTPTPARASADVGTLNTNTVNTKVTTGSMHWRVEAGVISSDYGARWGKMHKGIDIAADVGEPVYAVADGDVIYAGDGLRGYGNVIIIQHGQHLSSLYAHNSELKVKQGDHVGQGTLIALMGSTGHSTGPHVHFELRQGDVAVNPRTLLPAASLAEASSGAALSARR
jgi:murein DD-endopeptidase MepM/ murein hydrolase activator NlpD